jgi:hypothetical protein
MEAGEARAARETLTALVRADPADEAAAALLELFAVRTRAEGRVGIAIAVAAALGAAALLVWALRGRRSAAGAARTRS